MTVIKSKPKILAFATVPRHLSGPVISHNIPDILDHHCHVVRINSTQHLQVNSCTILEPFCFLGINILLFFRMRLCYKSCHFRKKGDVVVNSIRSESNIKPQSCGLLRSHVTLARDQSAGFLLARKRSKLLKKSKQSSSYTLDLEIPSRIFQVIPLKRCLFQGKTTR